MRKKGSSGPARTLFVHSSNEMYGADRILLEVLRALPRAERELSLVYLPDDLPPSDGLLGKQLKELGVNTAIGPLPVLRRRYLTVSGLLPLLHRIWQTYRIMGRVRPDIVYATTTAMVLCLPLARLMGVKSAVLHVQEIWNKRESFFLGFFARSATHVLCISAASMRSIGSALISRATLLVNAHQESGNALVPIRPSGPVRFLVASRWNAWKGHATLLEAWDWESNEGELLILGGPPPVGKGVNVNELVEKLRNKRSVKIIGEVRNIEPYLDDVDFLILPSDSPEPFGLVILEAFARGRAVIASRAGGVIDIVEDGRTGRLYEIGDVNDLRLQLTSVDKATAQHLGNNARQRYLEIYSIEAYRHRFSAVWSEISRGEEQKVGRNANG